MTTVSIGNPANLASNTMALADLTRRIYALLQDPAVTKTWRTAAVAAVAAGAAIRTAIIATRDGWAELT